MFEFLISFYFWIPYTILNIVCSYLLYYRMLKFFNPKYITEKSGRTINIHDLYPEWKQYKTISYWRFLYGFTFFVWIRIFTWIFILFILWLALKINSIGNRKNKNVINFAVKAIISLNLWLFGLIATRKRIQPNDLYTHYLGPGSYDNFDSNYSLIISNHSSWYEILYILCQYVPGFISKIGVKKAPLLGFVTENIDSLFIDRANEEDRNLIVIKI